MNKIKKYNRIFTFGCSFTRYDWPTWADIIKYDVDIPLYNWGVSGIGNVGIMHRIVECDITHKFTNKDLILVTWSGWSREDRYLNNTWVMAGNVFNHKFYDKKWTNKYWSEKNDIIKNAVAIFSANKMYNIQFNGTITKFLNEPIYDSYTSGLPHITALPEIIPFDRHDKIWGNDPTAPNLLQDPHPDILEHLSFVNTRIYPKFGLEMQPTTISYFSALQEKIILDAANTQFNSQNDVRKLMRDTIGKYPQEHQYGI